MEERRMDRGECRYGIRLLALSPCLFLGALFLAAFPGWAQNSNPNLEALARIETDSPQVGEPFILTILVDHPNPQETIITPPAFPSALVLDSVRSGVRYLEPPIGPEGLGAPRTLSRWTAVEYKLIPLAPGPLRIGAFEALVPGKRAFTRELVAEIRRSGAPSGPPRLLWENPPPLRVGETGEIRLYIAGWNPPEGYPGDLLGPPLEAGEIYGEDAPLNCAVEIYPENIRELRLIRGVPSRPFLRFSLVPLSGVTLSLPAAEIFWQNHSLEIPALEASLLAFQHRGGSQNLAREPVEVQKAEETPPPMDWGLAKSPGIFGGPLTSIIREAQKAFEEDKSAESLAILRRGERDLLAGSALIPLRRSLEERLGLDFQESEAWRPKSLFGALGILFIAAFLGIIIVGKRKNRSKKNVTSRRSWGYRVIPILPLVVSLLCFGVLKDAGFPAMGRFGIARDVRVYRIPDLAGEGERSFQAGERALIRSVSGDWVYVESLDGRSGWIPADAIVPY